jgi:hypothetical protein
MGREASMAGKYAWIVRRDDPEEEWRFENDYDDDEPAGFVKGQTHGCDCCSDTVVLDVKDLEAHIVSLKQAVKEAEAALEYLRSNQKEG